MLKRDPQNPHSFLKNPLFLKFLFLIKTNFMTEEIKFQLDKPDGTLRKLMDSSRINLLGWKPSIPLEKGHNSIKGYPRHTFFFKYFF